MSEQLERRIARRAAHSGVVVLGALGGTAFFFLVLPLIQAIHQPPSGDSMLTSLAIADVPPPPPPPEEEPEEEEQEEEPPPDLEEEVPPLDLSQLELALNPGLAGDWLGGDFSSVLATASSGGDTVDALFSQSDLDQAPIPIHQVPPTLTPPMRSRAPGSVVVIFEVDPNGRVRNPKVKQSSDPVFEPAVLAAIREWRFEPGKRNGEPVRTRMLQPFAIPR
jgi:protein TonB